MSCNALAFWSEYDGQAGVFLAPHKIC